METGEQLRARSFGANADRYQRTRPSYPAALLDAVLKPGWTTVADVGAGTGKLTELLCARGLQVTAVEPDAAMRSVLAVTAPSATVVDGTGEAIPLPCGSVDAVIFAQAWHWVDQDHGFLEAARVLKPGGSLLLIWNVRPDDEPWVAAMDEITDSGADIRDFDDILLHPCFEAPTRVAIPWSESITRVQLVERATTWSGVSTLPDAARVNLLGRLRTFLDEHPDLPRRDPIALPHVALAFVYQVSTTR